jgi:hypothetical protein
MAGAIGGDFGRGRIAGYQRNDDGAIDDQRDGVCGLLRIRYAGFRTEGCKAA